jgi:hypothetical protein
MTRAENRKLFLLPMRTAEPSLPTAGHRAEIKISFRDESRGSILKPSFYCLAAASEFETTAGMVK